MTTFYFVRHGQKVGEAGDPALTEHGKLQAQKTAKYLLSKNISKIFSSTYKRTRETSKIIDSLLKVGVKDDDRLRERMNWGSVQGQSLKEFLKEWGYSDLNRHFRPKAGKSSFESGKEILNFIEDVSKEFNNANIAVVTHGGVVIDLLRNLFSDSEIEKHKPSVIKDKVGEGSVTVLIKKGNMYVLEELGSTLHLQDIDKL